MIEIYNELKLLIQELNKNNIDYALCGGLAVSLHGFVRATVDIDMIILIESINEVRRILTKLHYFLESPPMSFLNKKIHIFRFTKIEQESGDFLPVDLLILDEQLNHIWNYKQTYLLENIPIQALNKEGLVELKKLRNSYQDKQDIEKLRGHNE